MTTFIVLWWVVPVTGSIYYAYQKNRSIAGWALLAFLFGWIALLIIGCIRPLPKLQ